LLGFDPAYLRAQLLKRENRYFKQTPIRNVSLASMNESASQ